MGICIVVYTSFFRGFFPLFHRVLSWSRRLSKLMTIRVLLICTMGQRVLGCPSQEIFVSDSFFPSAWMKKEYSRFSPVTKLSAISMRDVPYSNSPTQIPCQGICFYLRVSALRAVKKCLCALVCPLPSGIFTLHSVMIGLQFLGLASKITKDLFPKKDKPQKHKVAEAWWKWREPFWVQYRIWAWRCASPLAIRTPSLYQ